MAIVCGGIICCDRGRSGRALQQLFGEKNGESFFVVGDEGIIHHYVDDVTHTAGHGGHGVALILVAEAASQAVS